MILLNINDTYCEEFLFSRLKKVNRTLLTIFSLKNSNNFLKPKQIMDSNVFVTFY